MSTVAGIDIGTTTVSAVAVNATNGEVLFSKTVKNDSFIKGEAYNRMQNPSRILEIVDTVFAQMKSAVNNINSIGITGQMHGIVYVDKDGKAVTPLYTWQDESGLLPYKNTTYVDYLSEYTGYKLASGFGIVTHYVNQKLCIIPSSAVKFCTIQDLVTMHLTGRKVPLCHTSNAASFGCFDIKNGKFNTEKLTAAGFDTSYLPEITRDFAVAGNTKDGTPVTTAIGDNQASVLGSAKENMGLVNIGTGSQISVPCNSNTASGDVEIRPLFEDKNMFVGAPLCGGRSYAMLKDFFTSVCKEFCNAEPDIYEIMGRLAAENPDEIPLEIDTRFCGTRQNPELRGKIENIGINTLTPQNLTKGFLYSMANELFSLYTEIKKCGDTYITAFAGSGNGVRRNPVLREYLSRKFMCPILVPKHSEEAAFGAALASAVTSGIYKTVKEAQENMIKYEK